VQSLNDTFHPFGARGQIQTAIASRPNFRAKKKRFNPRFESQIDLKLPRQAQVSAVLWFLVFENAN
jgi:hypothetical protein